MSRKQLQKFEDGELIGKNPWGTFWGDELSENDPNLVLGGGYTVLYKSQKSWDI